MNQKNLDKQVNACIKGKITIEELLAPKKASDFMFYAAWVGAVIIWCGLVVWMLTN
jgi:hypothetical protein